MLRATSHSFARVPYSSLFTYNLILRNVFEAAPDRVAIKCESPATVDGKTLTSVHTYGELQEDILSCASEYLAVREATGNARAGHAKKSSKRWPCEASIWQQQPKSSNMVSIFEDDNCNSSNSTTNNNDPPHPSPAAVQFSCDVLDDDGRYNAALLCNPSYEFVVGLLALWAINMMAVPVCHTHHYESR